MSTVFEIATNVFGELQKNEKGKRLLKENDQTFLFDVTDEEPFLITIKNGQALVQKGEITWPPENREQWLNYSWMQADKDTFAKLFKGTLGPMAAYYRGKLKLSGLVSDVKQPIDAWMFKLMLGGKTRPINLDKMKSA